MNGEKNLEILLKTMKPLVNVGEFVFCTVQKLEGINQEDLVMIFKEGNSLTLITKKEVADILGLNYSFIATWITLTVHSALDAIGLTAAFSKALTDEHISFLHNKSILIFESLLLRKV